MMIMILNCVIAAGAEVQTVSMSSITTIPPPIISASPTPEETKQAEEEEEEEEEEVTKNSYSYMLGVEWKGTHYLWSLDDNIEELNGRVSSSTQGPDICVS